MTTKQVRLHLGCWVGHTVGSTYRKVLIIRYDKNHPGIVWVRAKGAQVEQQTRMKYLHPLGTRVAVMRKKSPGNFSGKSGLGPTDRRPVGHYMQGRWEVIEVIDGMMPKTLTPYQGFLWGNAVKYVMRFPYKGKPVEDLTKATTYLNWLKESIGAKR
jgi:hypothetical protein